MTEEVEIDPFAEVRDEQLEQQAVALLAQAGTRGPSTDDEYDAHYEHIRRVRRSHDSTHKLFTKRSKYSPEREAQQSLVLDELRENYKMVPTEGKALFLGGMPGSGKTTTVQTHPELIQGLYAETNPDSVKNAMIRQGLAPEIPGLLPLETDELIRYEAGILDGILLDELISQRKNVVIDRTMGSVSQIKKLIDRLQGNGYGRLEAMFMDIEPELGHERIRRRHRLGLDRYLESKEGHGERPVPGTAVKASRPKEGSPFRTANAAVFYELAEQGAFHQARAFDGVTGDEIGLEALRIENAE